MISTVTLGNIFVGDKHGKELHQNTFDMRPTNVR